MDKIVGAVEYGERETQRFGIVSCSTSSMKDEVKTLVKESNSAARSFNRMCRDLGDLKGRTNLWYLPHQRWRSGKFKSWRHR
jgi:hypothetical protein